MIVFIIIKSFLSKPFRRNSNKKYRTKKEMDIIITENALIWNRFFIDNKIVRGIKEIKKTLNIFLLKGIIEV